jgi:hypothetical protein
MESHRENIMENPKPKKHWYYRKLDKLEEEHLEKVKEYEKKKMNRKD